MAAVILTPVICTSDAPLLRLGSDSPRKEGKRREFNFTLAVLDRPTDREKMPAENAHDIEPARPLLWRLYELGFVLKPEQTMASAILTMRHVTNWADVANERVHVVLPLLRTQFPS